jgi:hypothetical protein
MRRLSRPRPITLVLALLAPVLLVLGIWLGSHPGHLPGFARGVFVDKHTQVVADAYDLIRDDYVRKVPESKLADAAIKGMVGSLGDPLLRRRAEHRRRRAGPARHARVRRLARVACRPAAG